MAAVVLPPPPAHRSARTESRFALRLLEPRVRILSVSAHLADHRALEQMIDSSRWQIVRARTCGEAVRELWTHGARVVFSERTLPDGEWSDILERIADLDEPPRFVVVSQLTDESLWFEVLQLGGYDVLSKPLVEDEVRSVLGSVPARSVRPVRRAARLFVVRTRTEF